MKWKFEKGTQTIRTVPENHCVTVIDSFLGHGYTDSALNVDKVASLIAAAPELLDALENALKLISALSKPNKSELRINIRARKFAIKQIINKAKGN